MLGFKLLHVSKRDPWCLLSNANRSLPSSLYISGVICVQKIHIKSGTNHTNIIFFHGHFFSCLGISKCCAKFRNDWSTEMLQNYSLTLLVLMAEYSWWTRSVPWLLIAWLLESAGQQQPWYWLCVMGRTLSSIIKDFSCLSHRSFEKKIKKC